MESVCYDVKRVLSEKTPQALVVEYAESAIIFSLRFWLNDAGDGIRPVISEVLISLKERFDDEGIIIPFPQRDLHIRSAPVPQVKDGYASAFPIAHIKAPDGRRMPV